jgi:UDP-N-acetylmuramoyl-tripeptide--D-alanyl-D-alanine ligase
MITLTLAEIAQAVSGQLIGTDLSITGVSIDTRKLMAGDLYIAIIGAQFDGHDFIEQAKDSGALAVLTTCHVATPLAQIIVADTRLALAKLAGLVRDKVNPKVCGITGSNGKTTVKEMLATILAVKYQVLFTQGNLNNDIGVPLTLLALQERHQYAVVEMGANHIGEIAYTSQYARPDVAVITNVGAAHIEGFGSIDGVATAKAEIIQSLASDGVAILNADDPYFSKWQAIAEVRKVITFGVSSVADVRAENISSARVEQHFNMQFDLLVEQDRVAITMALAGEHNVKNALAASAAAIALGVSLEQIQQGLQQVKAVPGRLQLGTALTGGRIINDTYNANPSSLAAALQVLKDCSGDLWCALGAFGELGMNSEQMHRDMGVAIKQAGVTRLFAIGAMAKHSVQAFGKGGEFFSTHENLISALQQGMATETVLLVKGSRAQKMERVVNALLTEVGK